MKYHILRQVGKGDNFQHLMMSKRKKELKFVLQGLKDMYPKYKFWIVESSTYGNQLSKRTNIKN